MRLAVFAAALALIGLILALEIAKIAGHGLDPLDAVSVLVLALFGIGILGALRTPPDA